MSENLESLKGDIKRNVAAMSKIDSTADVVSYMKGTFWPFLESMLEEISEHDDMIDELTEQVDDTIHADTAATLAAPITMAIAIIAKLVAQVEKTEEIVSAVAQFSSAAEAALGRIDEITVQDESADEDDDEPEVKE